jgi:hypothetical protein
MTAALSFPVCWNLDVVAIFCRHWREGQTYLIGPYWLQRFGDICGELQSAAAFLGRIAIFSVPERAMR